MSVPILLYYKDDVALGYSGGKTRAHALVKLIRGLKTNFTCWRTKRANLYGRSCYPEYTCLALPHPLTRTRLKLLGGIIIHVGGEQDRGIVSSPDPTAGVLKLKAKGVALAAPHTSLGLATCVFINTLQSLTLCDRNNFFKNAQKGKVCTVCVVTPRDIQIFKFSCDHF